MPELNTFTYTYKIGGQKLTDEINAPSIAQARIQLSKKNINPLKIRKKNTGIFGGLGGKKIKVADVAVFTRQLATMMKTGIPIVDSLDITGDSTENPSLKSIIKSVRNDVSDGLKISEAIRKHPKAFDNLYCNLIDAGEQAGAMDSMLEQLATYMEKSENTRKKIKKALTYPVAILFVALVITSFMLIYVIPQFENIFKSMGAELPAITQLIVKMSDFLIENGIVFFSALGSIVGIFIFTLKKNQRFSDKMDSLLLKVPMFGGMLVKSCIARFARTLSTTFAAGVPLVEALAAAQGTSGNAVYRDAIGKMQRDLSQGGTLTESMTQSGVFPNLAVQMTNIGEETGALDEMLSKLASYFEDEVDADVDGLSAMIEPIVMVGLGGLVGGMITAMYLPIFKLS